MIDQRKLQNAETIFFHFSTMVNRGLIEVLKDELSNSNFANVLQEACETALEIIHEKQKEETAAEECPPVH